MPTPWHSSPAIGFANQRTDEADKFGGRLMETFGHRQLPLSFRTAFSAQGAHQGAVPTGRIDEIFFDGDIVRAKGVFSDSAEGKKAAQMAEDGSAPFVSMDAGSYEYRFEIYDKLTGEVFTREEAFQVSEEVYARLDQRTVFEYYEIAGLTQVSIPAFAGARISLGESEMSGEVAASGLYIPPIPALSAPEKQLPIPSLGTDPLEQFRFGRMVSLKSRQPELRAERNPARVVAMDGPRHPLVSGEEIMAAALGGTGWMPPEFLSAIDFVEPSLMTVTPDREVFGHIALWDTPHAATGQILRKRNFDVSPFHGNHQVQLTNGELSPAGNLTMDGAHCKRSDKRGAERVAEIDSHYENTASIIGRVRARIDDFGIYIHGCLNPGITEEQMDTFLSSSTSVHTATDPVSHKPSLRAVLMVPVPGYPVGSRTDAEGEEIVASITDMPSLGEIQTDMLVPLASIS